MRLFRPRTIRGQLIGGLILFESVLVMSFAGLIIGEHIHEIRQRASHRMEYQATMLSMEAAEDIDDRRMDRLTKTLLAMATAPSIRAAQVTNNLGVSIANTDQAMVGKLDLTKTERGQLPLVHGPKVFPVPGNTVEVVNPVYLRGERLGYVWVYPNDEPDKRDLHSLILITLLFAAAGTLGCTILADIFARSITLPLRQLLRATQRLIRDPEDTATFPLTITSSNEAADLTMAFNLMVTSIEEQRAGLNDTLALLDSMLANAPIGFAFFDKKFHFVRVNQFLADMNGLSINRHLGRKLSEILPAEAAEPLEQSIQSVFDTAAAVPDLELTQGLETPSRNWLVNLYPVKTTGQAVRWVGAVIVDTTERRRAEDALRKTEKLAAAGRLAASIAHEINNPLEAVTNLLYLLSQEPLEEQARAYAALAQHEVARVSQITQQTLRFYRQSTVAAVSNVSELLDSVLSLHQGRVHSLRVEVIRQYEGDVNLFCFAGELRQLFANLIGNALDAMLRSGGQLRLTVRNSRSWRHSDREGVRIFVTDTGSGMSDEVKRRIFEPFFTTKEDTGTGLGLWVSAEILQKHAASVRVRSRPADPADATKPSGTIFMIFFPAGGRELDPSIAQIMATPAIKGI
jgi:PAS domain S-box-containing protein